MLKVGNNMPILVPAILKSVLGLEIVAVEDLDCSSDDTIDGSL